jgi:non-specific serine/threonine protein kinase/serine/threonine-protein kinase
MDPGRWDRVKVVFQEAFERAPSERGAVLDAACEGDAGLREDVERLLRAHARGGCLDSPPSLELDPADITEAADDSQTEEVGGAPSRIGAYRILRELGRGGMGSVYLAERDEPGLRKRVAVKLVRQGRDSAFVVRRFRTERQILAALEHPGIARLYDGGTTQDGLPYFVMEYVDGEDLLAYCDARRLPITTRLRLFLRICDAVQYAHQSLVVHRDLKPSNVLVTADGDPKLLDFGIAKLLGPQPAEAGVEETASVIRLMTPDYASPEQVRGERVTTATDVYSLGVILYQLLSGHRPYRVQGKGAAEIERALLEQDVDPPSTAAARTEEVTARGGSGTKRITPADVSAQRQAVPRRLRRQLRGDLDNVVLKALRRDPAERYATAAELGEDIRRHLEGFPVRARADSRTYRVAKFLRRHRAGAAAVGVAALGLLTGLGVAVRQARVAEAERRRAEARFQDVRRLANSVIYELHDAIANLPGATPARQLMVTRALEYLDRLAGEGGDDLALKRELADAYQRLAQLQNSGLGANLGDTKGAIESYGKALAIRESLAARAPVDSQDVLGLALLEFDLGTLHRAQGRPGQAEQSFMSSASRLEGLERAGALPDAQRGRLGGVYQRLAEAQSFQGKRDEALRTAEKAVATAEKAWSGRRQDAASRSILAAASYQLAVALADKDRYAEALERTRQARALLEAGLRENPLDAQQTRVLLYVLNGESDHLWRLGDQAAAARVRERALEVAEKALRRDPRDRWSQMGVAIAAKALGDVLLETGDARESARRFRQALRIDRQVVAEDPGYTFARLEAAYAEHGLARALLAQGTRESVTEGCAGLERVRQFWEGLRAKGELPAGEVTQLESLPRWLARCPSGR